MFSKLFSIFSTNNTSYKKTDMKDMHYYIKSTEVQVNSPKSPLLTQSELQQVQDVMRERLRKLEVIRGSFILAAKGYKLDGHKDTSEIYYDEAAKIKKRIKSLAAIQAKIKHSIVTLG